MPNAIRDPGMVEGIAVAVVSAVGAVVVALVERGRRDIGRAVRAADEAADYARPTGNGYAARTEASLRRIEDTQAETRRDIGGMRSEVRDLRRTDADLYQRLTDLHRKDNPDDQ